MAKPILSKPSSRDRARQLLLASRLLTEDLRQIWLSRVPELDEAACERLCHALKQESEFIMGSLEEVLVTALRSGDQATVEAFKQTLAESARMVGAREEAHDKRDESDVLNRLESDLTNL